MSTRILIIGGTRFLGLEIVKVFLEKGCEVTVMNRGRQGAAPDGTESIRCDKADRGTFAKALRRQWDVIVDTILSAEDLDFVVETLGADVGHFLHTGSLGVYGDARAIPATESLPLAESADGEDVVFNNKIQQDQVLLRAFHEKKFPATILRQSYIYGPGDILLDGWGGRSAEFFQRLQKEEPVCLPGDGRALLHPGHVRDLARAFGHAADRPESIGQAYNVAGSHALMMKDYVALIAGILGVEPRLEFAPVAEVVARDPEIINERGLRFSTQHMCASIAKAKEQLQWQPKISLPAGLRENLAWMRENRFLPGGGSVLDG